MSRIVTAPPPEVAALARALPGSLPPDVLFGIGGGTGFGRSTSGDEVTLLTRIGTTETASGGFLADVCHRLHVPFRLRTATTPEALRADLDEQLRADRIPIVWVEPGRLPWPAPPAALQAVAVLTLDREATVFDGEERTVPVDVLLRAARTAGIRHRWLVVEGAHGDVGSAVRAGLEAHREQMHEGFGPPEVRSRFGLAGIARWTVEVTEDARHGPELADQIERRGGGPAMRVAQSAFLAYAGHERAAAAASAAANRWGELAAALRGGYAGVDHVRAVHDAEADALAAIQAALRAR